MAMQNPFIEATELGFSEDFQNAHPLWNAEVSFILDKYLNKQKQTDLKSMPQNAMIQKTLDYTSKLNNYSTPQTLSMAAQLLLTLPHIYPKL